MSVFLTKKYRWYRVVIFGLIFMFIPIIIDHSWQSYWRHFYQVSPISSFYKSVSFEVTDVCLTELTQVSTGKRFVYGTDTGWRADIVRELNRIDKNSYKVFDEPAEIFIEIKEDGLSHREITLPSVVREGDYQWEISINRLYLPMGVVRTDVPPLKSNVFKVKNCVAR